MSWIVKVLTGYKCKCGQSFDGENALKHFMDHISQSTGGTHGLENEIYTSLPSMETVIVLVILGILIASAIAYFIFPTDKRITLLDAKVNKLQESNEQVTNTVHEMQEEKEDYDPEAKSYGDVASDSPHELSINTPDVLIDNGSGVNKITLHVNGAEYELQRGKASCFVLQYKWVKITIVQLFNDGNYLEYNIRLKVTKDTEIKFIKNNDGYDFTSDPNEAIVSIN